MSVSSYEIETVRSLPLFSGLPPRTLNEILSNAIVRVHSKGEIIFMQDDEADRFFIVLTGWVKVYRMTSDGEVTMLEVYGPGDSFAEGAMHMEGGYPASAEMVETGRLMGIPTHTFKQQLREDPDLAMNMFARLAIRMKALASKVERMGTLSAPQRVATFLIRYCPATAVEGEGVVVPLPYDKQLIASRLAMTPETFSRSLQKLAEVGVHADSHDVHVEDIAVLKKFANPDE
jgi:CRP-like cAMP-binding protein